MSRRPILNRIEVVSEEQHREFERKFLVTGTAYRAHSVATHVIQGYLSTDIDRTVRVRIEHDDKATLTIKGRSSGEAQAEFEYEIPLEDARRMLADMCSDTVIEKTRHSVTVGGNHWVVDEFAGRNEGLVLAEIESGSSPDLRHAVRDKPEWVGADVTTDYRYRNSNLISHPYSQWSDEERASIT